MNKKRLTFIVPFSNSFLLYFVICWFVCFINGIYNNRAVKDCIDHIIACRLRSEWVERPVEGNAQARNAECCRGLRNCRYKASPFSSPRQTFTSIKQKHFGFKVNISRHWTTGRRRKHVHKRTYSSQIQDGLFLALRQLHVSEKNSLVRDTKVQVVKLAGYVTECARTVAKRVLYL